MTNIYLYYTVNKILPYDKPVVWYRYVNPDPNWILIQQLCESVLYIFSNFVNPYRYIFSNFVDPYRYIFSNFVDPYRTYSATLWICTVLIKQLCGSVPVHIQQSCGSVPYIFSNFVDPVHPTKNRGKRLD